MKQRSNPDIGQLLLGVGGAIVLLLVIKDLVKAPTPEDVSRGIGSAFGEAALNIFGGVPPGVKRIPAGSPDIKIVGATYDNRMRPGSGMNINVDFSHKGPPGIVELVVYIKDWGGGVVGNIRDDGQWLRDDAAPVRYRSSLSRPFSFGPGHYSLLATLQDGRGQSFTSKLIGDVVVV